MPPRKFLKKFLATDEGTPGCPDSEGAFESVLSAKKEVDMYHHSYAEFFVSAPTVLYQHLIDNSGDAIRG
jgi:hypothetical protein